MIIPDLLPPFQGLDRIVISPDPRFADAHLGLFAATPTAFEQGSRQKRLTYMQPFAKQIGCRLVALPASTQVSS